MDNNEEIQNIYYIPANFGESGRVLNGMFATRNAIEAGIFALVVGYPVLQLNIQLMTKLIVLLIAVAPVAFLALIGVDGDSLSQYVIRLWKYRKQRRALHLSKPKEFPKDTEKEAK